MCSLVAHDRLQLYYKDDESSIGDRSIPDDKTVKILEALGATINSIDIWIKFLREHFEARCEAYINAMKVMFRQIPHTIKIALTPKQKFQKIMIDIGGEWYMGKNTRGLPPLSTNKLSKKAQERQDIIQIKIYEANKRWNDWKLQLHWNKLEWVDPKSNPKRVKIFSVSSKTFYIDKIIEQLIGLAILN